MSEASSHRISGWNPNGIPPELRNSSRTVTVWRCYDCKSKHLSLTFMVFPSGPIMTWDNSKDDGWIPFILPRKVARVGKLIGDYEMQ
jgi:hypothetical protein